MSLDYVADSSATITEEYMNKALEYALKLLAKKDYTEAEIRQKFLLREMDKGEAEEAILLLRKKCFVNDERYTENFIKLHRSRGSVRIKYELIKRGVSEDVITQALAHLSRNEQVERAQEVAVAWINKKQGQFQDKYKLKANLVAKLSRQGFPYDVAMEAIEGLL